jgi:hypothetical protein
MYRAVASFIVNQRPRRTHQASMCGVVIAEVKCRRFYPPGGRPARILLCETRAWESEPLDS